MGNHGIFDLTGKTALITGGAGVLGLAMARALAGAGARVAITSRTEAKAGHAAESLGVTKGQILGLAMEAMDRASIEVAFDRAESALGPVSILVNAAGGNVKGATVTAENPFVGLELGALKEVVESNLFAGAMLPSQVAVQRLAERKIAGSIINITSVSAFLPLSRILGYGAAKAGVSNFTQWLAVHLAMDMALPIRVNAIMPGFFLTEQNRFLLTQSDGGLTDRGARIVSQTPMGRFGEPGELGGAAVWLASEASRFVTGAVIPVDGGFTAYSGV